MEKIDLDIIKAQQLLAPGKSGTDAKTACGLILNGQVFAEFRDEERMKDFDKLTPSLYTFFILIVRALSHPTSRHRFHG